MKKRPFLWIASALMILIGILRGLGGISLYIKGGDLVTNIPLIASEKQIDVAALGLIIVCILLIYSGLLLLLKNSLTSWRICLAALVLFLTGGIINGYVLFGHPVNEGQLINLVVVVIVAGFLILGKSALREN